MAVHYQNKKYGNGAYLSCFTCTVCKTRKKRKKTLKHWRTTGRIERIYFLTNFFFSCFQRLHIFRYGYGDFCCYVLLRLITRHRRAFHFLFDSPPPPLFVRVNNNLQNSVYFHVFFFFFPVVYLCLCLLPAVLFRLDHNFQHIFVAKYNKAVVELCWVRDKVMSIINCDVPGR